MTKTLNVVFESDRFEKLKELKGDRSWSEAILEEFGVDLEDDA